MPRKKKRKLQASDIAIVAVCLSLCFTSLWFFWKDLNSSSTRTDVDKIAEISFKKNIAQRKFSDRVVWERLQQNSPLYDADTIRTSDGAEAKITFNDGTVVEISENTMIQVSLSSDGSVNLSVDGGNIAVDTTASASSSVNLSLGEGSLVKLDSGSKILATSFSDSNASNISVQSGNALVSNANGESTSLKKGQSVSMEESGEIKMQSVTVTSISKNLRVFKVEEKTEPVKIEWQTLEVSEDSLEEEKEKTVLVETYKDKDYTQLISSFTAKGSSSVEIEPSEDKIYWRVYAEGEKDKAVEGRIQVVDIQNVSLTSPINNSVFKYRKEYPSLHFNWEESEYADFYRFEISAVRDFSQSLISEDLKETSFITSDLGSGTYYWRVTPHYAVNEIGFLASSETYNFAVEEKTSLTAPSLMLPSANAKITLGNTLQNVSFSWKSDVKNAAYTLLISSTEDFSKIVYEYKTSATSILQRYDILSLPVGTYYWKIQRKSEEDEESIFSEPRTFTVLQYVPGENRLVYPPDNYSVEEQALKKLSFSWKLAKEYEEQNFSSIVQFSKDLDFTTIEKEIITEDSQISDLNFPQGKYYWRVAAKSTSLLANSSLASERNINSPLAGGNSLNVSLSDGRDSDENILGYSAIRSVNVLSELGGVSFISPVASSKIIIGENENLLIYWSKVSGADYYKCLIQDSSGKTVYKADKLLENQVRLKLLSLQEGDSWTSYSVSVTAYSEESDYSSFREGKNSSIMFQLRTADVVKLVYPVNNVVYDGLEALRNPVTLSWRAGDTPLTSSLLIQKQDASGTWRTVRTIENPSFSESLYRLSEGRYRWTVLASSSEKLSLDAKEYGTFVIQKIDGQYLRKNRNITFKWSSVSGATDYEFVIYQVLNNGGLKKIYSSSVKNTEVSIKNLSIFDVGTFEWQVTAISHAKDGFEEQKGVIASSRFTIDFQLPKKVETVKPGTMYGD